MWSISSLLDHITGATVENLLAFRLSICTINFNLYLCLTNMGPQSKCTVTDHRYDKPLTTRKQTDKYVPRKDYFLQVSKPAARSTLHGDLRKKKRDRKCYKNTWAYPNTRSEKSWG